MKNLRRLSFVLCLLTIGAVISGCTSSGTNSTSESNIRLESKPEYGSILAEQPLGGGKLKLKRMDGRIAIALLLPFSDPRDDIQNIATDMHRAAQLALFDMGFKNIVLIIKDTRGTPAGAEFAAREALQEGAEIIIGPVFSSSIGPVAALAKQAAVPVLAFSNDQSVRSEGVWLLGILPEQNMDYIIAETVSRGLTRFAVLLPENELGKRLYSVIPDIIESYGGELIEMEVYPQAARSMFGPVQRLAHFNARKVAYDVEKKRILGLARAIVPNSKDEASLMRKIRKTAPALYTQYIALGRNETLGEIPYDVVLMPEGGLALRNLAPLLPYFDIHPKLVKFVGSHFWDDPNLSKEPPLQGGWFAAPDPAGWEFFNKKYNDQFSQNPVRIATIAYDALSLVGALISSKPEAPFSYASLTRANGFKGVDGVFRLLPDGTNQRGFAIQEIGKNKNKIISRAPQTFAEMQRRHDFALARARELTRAPQIYWQEGKPAPALSNFLSN